MKWNKIDRNLTMKLAVVTPRIILSQVLSRGLNKNSEQKNTHQSGDNSWATVARKGKEKENVNLSTRARVAS